MIAESEVIDDIEETDDDRLIFDPSAKYTHAELEAHADQILKDDSNRELCRKCRLLNPSSLPYGTETGNVESKPQYEKDRPILDEDGDQLYLDFPEFICDRGHRWFKGEGQRRDIRGPNPILFKSHLDNRKRREIMVESGVPDPAFTLDRFGKPTQGMYQRTHPAGRRVNTPQQRKRNGASFYRALTPLPLFLIHPSWVIYGILSVIVLCQELLHKKKKERRICGPIMKIQYIVRKSKNEIVDMPPLIE